MNYDLIRAWKDEDYRDSLGQDAQAELPANPAGQLELTDRELDGVNGGYVGFPTQFGRDCDMAYTYRTWCMPTIQVCY